MKTILIVDDQPEVRDLVEATLQIGNYRIIQAHDGPTAIEIATREQPDLVLLDIMMPSGGMNGFEVCSQLKTSSDIKTPTVILLSARGQTTDIEAGRQAGADDYFVKPFSPLELMQLVDKILTDSPDEQF